jgi:predicted metal-dependent HD superfamily phosphohydrolase
VGAPVAPPLRGHLLARWFEPWHELGLEPPAGCGEEVLDAWAEPSRHYHGLRHLADCLDELEAARELAERPAEVALAIWFHDAVYKATRSDNEAASAGWAQTALCEAQDQAEAEIDGWLVERVRRLILATRHDREPETPDERLIVDIDLAILGAAPERYDEYERDIRAEYRWVPKPLFRRKRREILRTFLARPTIYCTARFRDRYEAQARENLERACRLIR